MTFYHISERSRKMQVFRGRLVHSVGAHEDIQVLEDHLVGIKNLDGVGKILFIEHGSDLESVANTHNFSVDSVTQLTEGQFLMPGLVDTHIHAPQYVNSGTGYDVMLLDWLERYTFPTEAKFKDLEYAKNVYTKAVRRTLLHGTTTASYFATIHLEATKELCRVIERFGQRALVGKVNMDMESPEFYVEDMETSVEETRSFVKFAQALKNPLIAPVITPRFAPTCSAPLLRALGQLAAEYGVPIQSHMCEQLPEIEFTKKLFPQHATTADIFHHAGLMTNQTFMAHCIHLEKSELDMFEQHEVGVAHCPNSNFNLCSGVLDARRLLDRGIKVGLGTDISGGHSPSILTALRSSIDVSKSFCFHGSEEDYKVISHHHAFYMATLGGAKVLSLADKIGNFVVGKEFDALLIDTRALGCPKAPVFDVFEENTFDDILMKFLYLGDDRNILKRFVAGKEISL